MKTDFSAVKDLFAEKGLIITEKQYSLLSEYADFLVEYNEKVNLTAITDTNEIWVKHFLDSIVPLSYAELPENASIIDVGTGAGFPSVPMGVYRGDLKITMLDSLMKRITFLEQLSEKMELKNWRCIHSRAEDAGNLPEYRETFDAATARAVAALPVLCEYCMPFVKPGGIFIALKGPSECSDDAALAIRELGGAVEKEVTYEIGGEIRRLIVIRKISHTPTKYPRKSSRIKQKPL